MSATSPRQTADERRETVLEAASREFSRAGLHGASTDAIAKAAGISQPYLFRLFGTKKELYLATARLKMEEVYQAFERASRGKTGLEALTAMGEAYKVLIEDRERLPADAAVFRGRGRSRHPGRAAPRLEGPCRVVERVHGGTPAEISAFFAQGMLLNVLGAMRLFDDPTPWGARLIQGCRLE